MANDPSLTINFVGDLHHGRTPTSRLNTAKADLIASASYCAHRVYLGDLCDVGTNASHRSAAYGFLHDVGGSFDYVYGNHDYAGITSETINTEWGDYSTLNWVRDLSFCRIIGLNNSIITDGAKPCTLSPATLSWLGDRLAETEKICIIATHAPLGYTVVSWYTSFHEFFMTQPDADFRAVLDAHDNAKLVLSGHTHSYYTSPGMVSRVSFSTHDVLAINAGAIAYVTNPGPPSVPDDMLDDLLASPFVTINPDGIEIRWRDHATGTWFDGAVTEAAFEIPPPPEGLMMGRGHAPVLFAEEGLSAAQREALGDESLWAMETAALIYGNIGATGAPVLFANQGLSAAQRDAFGDALLWEIGTPSLAYGQVGSSGGPLAFYSQSLSDARRSVVSAAMDDGDDLWDLFEVWDTQLQPVDLLALQGGQATVGVTAEMQPVDLLALQSGQATAGVATELAVLELDMMGDELIATARHPFPYAVTWSLP